ncbi:single-stranded DNA-binding protein [Oceanimonas sp. NS1]|nr:single-stranded DNA-binding protein [Oceanimonas sp. NS1]
MNVCTFTGNLGRDCRPGNVGGTAVCNFAVAVKSGYGDKEQTLWLDCALWGRQAESRLTEYLVKGQQVAVSGELGTREHEGKTYLTLRVNQISLVGGRPTQGQTTNSGQQGNWQQQQPTQSQQATQPPADFDDDIPFAPIGLQYPALLLVM